MRSSLPPGVYDYMFDEPLDCDCGESDCRACSPPPDPRPEADGPYFEDLPFEPVA